MSLFLNLNTPTSSGFFRSEMSDEAPEPAPAPTKTKSKKKTKDIADVSIYFLCGPTKGGRGGESDTFWNQN